MRLAAVKALAGYHSKGLLANFVQAMHDGDARIRAYAAAAAGDCGNVQAVPPLLHALGDGDACVRAAASDALGKYLHSAPEVLAALPGEQATQRAAAAHALATAGGVDAAPTLAKLLTDPDLEVRAAALGALGKLGQTAAPALLPLLKDANSSTRALAARALARIQATTAIPALQALLHDPEPSVRLWVVSALGAMPNPELDDIVTGLQDVDPSVRAEAERIVGEHQLKLLARLLLHALRDGSTEERTAAHASLCALAGQDLGSTARVWENWVQKQ